MNLELFAPDPDAPERLALGPGSVMLRGLALPQADVLLDAVDEIWAAAPPRHLITPGGFRMSVALSNCGALGWTSDRRGYRYTRHDPQTGRPWPAMPAPFLQLAQAAARAAGFDGFQPDACLINHYVPGARLSLHQDKDEGNLDAPIVSVSLGIPAVFLFGGLQRGGPARRVPLRHGDVMVWGGPDRLRYHGVLPLQDATHPRVGRARVNLTFRHAS